MEQNADEILIFFEIDHLLYKLMTEMSSGEARRFLIGRALVHSPKTLVLDEPSTAWTWDQNNLSYVVYGFRTPGREYPR